LDFSYLIVALFLLGVKLFLLCCHRPGADLIKNFQSRVATLL